MTAFSYLVSVSHEKQFREPEILAKLLKRIIPALTSPTAHITGWTLHYAVGFGFNIIYDLLWRKTPMKPGLRSGVLLGGASGFIGAAVWKMVFKLHPFPPSVERNNYYKHLLLAHVVFGIFSTLGYKLGSGKMR